MEASIFLAKVFSIYFIVVGLSLAFNQKQYKTVINEICNNNAVMFLSGIMALILGSLLVVAHNVWVWQWPVAITIVSWVTFLKGVSRIAYPKLSLKTYNKMMKKDHWYWGTVVVTLVVGLYLGSYGFNNFS